MLNVLHESGTDIASPSFTSVAARSPKRTWPRGGRLCGAVQRDARQISAVPAVMKQQTALIAIPEEWILLLSGVLRRDTRLSIDLHVARRLVLRRITRIVEAVGAAATVLALASAEKPKAAPPMMPAAATGAATKRMRLRDMVAFILSFPLRVGCWVCLPVFCGVPPTLPRRSLNVSPPNGG